MRERFPSRIGKGFSLPPLAKRIMQTTALSVLAIVAAACGNQEQSTRQAQGEMKEIQQKIGSLRNQARMQPLMAAVIAANGTHIVYSPDGIPDTELTVHKKKGDETLFTEDALPDWAETMKTFFAGKTQVICKLADNQNSVTCTAR